MGSVRASLWMLLACSLVPPFSHSIDRCEGERQGERRSSLFSFGWLYWEGARECQSPPSSHPSFLPVQSSGRHRKSTLQQRAKTSLDAGCHLLWRLSTLRASGWATKCVQINHLQQLLVRFGGHCFHHSPAKHDAFFLLLPERQTAHSSLPFFVTLRLYSSVCPSIYLSIRPFIRQHLSFLLSLKSSLH